MSKGFKVTAVVLALVFLLSGAVFSAMTFFTVRAMGQEEEFSGYEEFASAEDGVVIAEEYTILPTTAISDAYRAGNSDGLNEKEKETLEMASGILEEIITDGMSDFEKELAVYDWMTSRLAYDEGSLVVIPTTDADSDNPYGVLKYHNAVCVGYATTFRLFMQMLDIPCMVVHNNELYHSWNLVQLDGHWYHVDIYADVGEGGYAAFNLPDAIRLQQQTWDTAFFPAADALTYNVAWRNRQDVSDVYTVPDALRKAMDDGTGAFALAFTCPVDGDTQELVEQMIASVNQALMQYTLPDLPDMIREWNWMPEQDGYEAVLTVFYHYGEDTPEETDPSEEAVRKQADEALQNAFGDLFYLSLYDGYYGDYEGYAG